MPPLALVHGGKETGKWIGSLWSLFLKIDLDTYSCYLMLGEIGIMEDYD